ncbi:DNA glycosylase AlkZ-like family protein [Streptomyces indonesiensis]
MRPANARAQEPLIGLWSRLIDFKPEQLDEALTGRRVVHPLMRRTVHLLHRRELVGIDLDEVATARRAAMADQQPHHERARKCPRRPLAQPASPRSGRAAHRSPHPHGPAPAPRSVAPTAGVRNLPLATWRERDIASSPPMTTKVDRAVDRNCLPGR